MHYPSYRQIQLSRHCIEDQFTIIAPVVDPDGENEWIIDDGTGPFAVLIQDEIFLDAVRTGAICFAHGCSIIAELVTTQWMGPDGVQTEQCITHVLEFIHPP